MRTALMAFATVLILAAAGYFGYQFTRQAPVEGNSVAIMYIENQTGNAANDEQVNNIIPQIYKKLFASHKNLTLASPAIRLDLESLQRAETIDKIAATDVMNKAGVKYRVAAAVQESNNGLDYILEMNKPGEHPIVWQETLVKPDSVTPAAFSQTLADWIEACIWVDEFEQRLAIEWNSKARFTIREFHTNYINKNVHATKYFYQGYYYFFSMESEKAIPFLENALKLDPAYPFALTVLCYSYLNSGRREKALQLLEEWKSVTPVNRFEQLLYTWTEQFFSGASDAGLRAMRELVKEDVYPDLWYYTLGWWYILLGDYDNGLLMLQKGVESGVMPKRTALYTKLAETYNNVSST